ncbi:aminotransferase class I/II-fold pyridoxal phosphate-dependent enzyme [Trinickia violacea]|uniref:Histidinol-phosphate aminotransferase n=1 Tax=Trinickia violacea TaxID=2571746 RepID=A0A4P8J3N9_9BURK|nr:histidinol-phosphate transaminase [Trinickia violacea]QCP54524.1 aminotransferase class I/II-fold pyridoxal phosphate-dependent enzyme [Trinickia violacea]
MDWSRYVLPQITGLQPYKPGITEEKLRRETGLTDIWKFSSNEAPVGPSPRIVDAMQAALGQANRYPDIYALLEALSQRLDVPHSCLALGNGSIDLIAALVRLFVGAQHNVVLTSHGYCAYPALIKEQQAAIRVAGHGESFGHHVDKLLSQVDADTRMVLIDSPTNLSGAALTSDEIRRLLEALPTHVIAVLDEAYIEYADLAAMKAHSRLPFTYPNVVITRTFSKAYGLAGLRVGYAVADAGLIDWLARIRPPFPVGSVALAAALAALNDQPHIDQILQLTVTGRRSLVDGLRMSGIDVIEGHGNFVLADFGARATYVYEGLLSHGLITRAAHAYGLPSHIRISVGSPGEIARLLETVRALLGTQVARDLEKVV